MNSKTTYYDYYIFTIFFIIACSLRLYRIGNFELWLDEAYTYHISVSSDFIDYIRNDNSPPLYYALMKFWGQFAGYSETAIRVPSAIFGAMCKSACNNDPLWGVIGVQN